MRYAKSAIQAAAVLVMILAAGPAAAADAVVLECHDRTGAGLYGSGLVRLSATMLEIWNPQTRAFQNACADRAPMFDPPDAKVAALKPAACDIAPGRAHLAWTASEPAKVMGQDVTLKRDIGLDLDTGAGKARETVRYRYLELLDYDDRRATDFECRPAHLPVHTAPTGG